MRHILSRGLLTVAAAGSVLAATGGLASADSDASGTAAGSPGLLSGNSISAPVDVPVNVCGDSVNAVAALNPALGSSCADAPATPTPTPTTTPPPAPATAPPATPQPQADVPRMAETGSGGEQLGLAAGAGAALLLGGAVLYRRGVRPAQALAGRRQARPAHARH
ncbi:chaplin [Streptomyces sp. NPDC020917]|uniref:chaplin n=1 Tax=Streptomyces sp. NPDC020917 TaxID=3365102 RepID=UPI0037ACB408